MTIIIDASRKVCCRGRRSPERLAGRAPRIAKRVCYAAATLCVLAIYVLRNIHFWWMSSSVREESGGMGCWAPGISRMAGSAPCQDVRKPDTRHAQVQLSSNNLPVNRCLLLCVCGWCGGEVHTRVLV